MQVALPSSRSSVIRGGHKNSDIQNPWLRSISFGPILKMSKWEKQRSYKIWIFIQKEWNNKRYEAKAMAEKSSREYCVC